MAGNSSKQRAAALEIEPNSRHGMLRRLVLDGFFDSPVSSEAVVRGIKERFGKRLDTNHVQTYMQKFMKADIIHAVKPTGHRGNYWILGDIKREDALRSIGKKRKVLELEEELFS